MKLEVTFGKSTEEGILVGSGKEVFIYEELTEDKKTVPTLFQGFSYVPDPYQEWTKIVNRNNAFEEGGILWGVPEILESAGYNCTANELKKLLGE